MWYFDVPEVSVKVVIPAARGVTGGGRFCMYDFVSFDRGSDRSDESVGRKKTQLTVRLPFVILHLRISVFVNMWVPLGESTP